MPGSVVALPDTDVVVTLTARARLDGTSALTADVAQVVTGTTELILLDGSEVEYATAAGMAELIHALRKARRHRADLRVFGASTPLHDVHTELGLHRVIPLYTDRVSAMSRHRLVLQRTVSRGRSQIITTQPARAAVTVGPWRAVMPASAPA